MLSVLSFSFSVLCPKMNILGHSPWHTYTRSYIKYHVDIVQLENQVIFPWGLTCCLHELHVLSWNHRHTVVLCSSSNLKCIQGFRSTVFRMERLSLGSVRASVMGTWCIQPTQLSHSHCGDLATPVETGLWHWEGQEWFCHLPAEHKRKKKQ